MVSLPKPVFIMHTSYGVQDSGCPMHALRAECTVQACIAPARNARVTNNSSYNNKAIRPLISRDLKWEKPRGPDPDPAESCRM